MYRNIDRIEELLNNIGQVLFRIDMRIFANIKKGKFETKPDSSFGFSSKGNTQYAIIRKMSFALNDRSIDGLKLTGFQELDKEKNKFPKDLRYVLSYGNVRVTFDVSDIRNCKIIYSIYDYDEAEKELVSVAENGNILLAGYTKQKLVETLCQISDVEELTAIEIIKKACIIKDPRLMEITQKNFMSIFSLNKENDKPTESQRKRFYLNELKRQINLSRPGSSINYKGTAFPEGPR